MKHKEQHSIACAAAKVGFSAATGHRLAKDPRLPSEKKVVRGRRLPDPLGKQQRAVERSFKIIDE